MQEKIPESYFFHISSMPFKTDTYNHTSSMITSKQTKIKKSILPVSLTVLAFITSLLFNACSKPIDTPVNDSRVVKYEVTGNFSGSLIASYTSAGGGTTNETITALPWTKEITYQNSVTAAIMAVSGNGGTAGQTVKIDITKETTKVSSTSATASASGSFTVSTPVVRF